MYLWFTIDVHSTAADLETAGADPKLAARARFGRGLLGGVLANPPLRLEERRAALRCPYRRPMWE